MHSIWFSRISRFVLACVAALTIALPAQGTSFSTDNSDLYLALNEDGWGVQMVQRGNALFATMYVYDANRFPIYYTATLFFTGTEASGKAIWPGAGNPARRRSETADPRAC